MDTRPSRLLLVATLLLAAACSGTDPTGGPGVGPLAEMTAMGGLDQTAVVATTLPEPLAVRLTDANGTPIEGHQVTFVVTHGGGSVFASPLFTDFDGEARNQWTLGASVADPQRVEARAIDSGSGQTCTVVFSATPLAGPASVLVKVGGDGQTGGGGETLAEPLVVRVEDKHGNPTPSVSVAWTVTAGGGSVSDSANETDQDGLASVEWSVGVDPSGDQVLEASVDRLQPVAFSATSCLQDWPSQARCFYPRAGAPSVGQWFDPTPPLSAQTPQGSIFGILDLAGRGDNTPGETVAAARTLEPLGIPHEIFTDVSRVHEYEIVQVAGSIREGDLSDSEIALLDDFVRAGGALILYNVADPNAYALAGIGSDRFDRLHADLVFVDGDDPLLAYLDHPNEMNAPISDGVVGIQSREYTCTDIVMATYDTGAAAICKQQLGAGSVYTFGLRPKIWQLFRQLGRTGGLELSYTNHFHPSGDLLTLILRGLYEEFVSAPQLRFFAPPGYQGVLIVTHDIDARSSVNNLDIYQTFEMQLGIRATYFVQTPPYSTGYTSGFYTPETVDVLLAEHESFEYGSHSFGHFIDFDECPQGTGDISAASYRPTFDAGRSIDCTAYGELGVSRYLLEQDLGFAVESFRSGNLLIPPGFYSTLDRLGYRRVSNIPAGFTGVHFPFVAFDYENPEVTEYAVMEYPLLLSDDKLDETNVAETVAQWQAVLAANAANGAPTVLLLHPSDRPGRFEAFEQFIMSVNDGTYWITDLKSFADFWESQGVVQGRPTGAEVLLH